MIDKYQQRAKSYDTSGISGLEPWRTEAVRRLNLKRGDVVVDIGCGTGLNFGSLQEAIGPEGKIIGVDLTDTMLDQARHRVAEDGWKNVDLVQIAIGAAGTDVAIEAAHVVLMRDDWTPVPEAFRIARRTMRVVKMNIAFTAIYNIVGLTLAAFGILPSILAAAAQSLPDPGILVNSSRLLGHNRIQIAETIALTPAILTATSPVVAAECGCGGECCSTGKAEVVLNQTQMPTISLDSIEIR